MVIFEPPPPGEPDKLVTSTPAIRPCNKFSTLGDGAFCKSSTLTEAIEPTCSRVFLLP